MHAGYLRLQAHMQAANVITAFPPQKWLHERASVLRLYVHCVTCVCSYSLCVVGQIIRKRQERVEYYILLHNFEIFRTVGVLFLYEPLYILSYMRAFVKRKHLFTC